MQEESKYTEEWTVIINRHPYYLNPEQSELLKRAIADGQKGVIMFDAFVINIPMIQEFYREKRTLNPKYILPEGNSAIPDEEREKAKTRINDIREKLKEKLR